MDDLLAAVLELENCGLRAHNTMLQEQLADSERKLVELQRVIDEFSDTKEKIGLIGETIFRQITGTKETARNHNHDFVCDNGERVEVKFSELCKADPPTFRWSWAKLFGSSRNKVYERLILIGNKDPRYSTKYSDQSSNFVFFDVPYDKVMPLTVSGGYTDVMIKLNTNPDKAKSLRAGPLFSDFQVDAQTLKQRYGSNLNREAHAHTGGRAASGTPTASTRRSSKRRENRSLNRDEFGA